DGREYDYNSYKYKSNTSQLWVWDRTFIKDEFAIKYPGTWKVELYINGKYLMSKKFTLEFDKKYEIVKPNINIGVINFRSKKLSRYKIGSGIGEYLAHGILDSNKNIKVVHPKEMKRYQPNMQIPEEKYEATILADISSSESQILEYAFKHKLDYVISGLAKASVESNSFDIEIESYLLDVKSKKLIAKKKTVHAVSLNQARQISLSKAWRSEYNKAVKMNLNELTPILKGL
ncbi:hypothetical protein, partial [Poseidonibacter ostreae]|uniref:hypothetical protein n=1 Tax=Poseidonibacter ostreae TaxID=2654171 RepID=UPI00186AC716